MGNQKQDDKGHVVISGGAGYIGSTLVSMLLRDNYQVTVLDNLLFGGESLLPHLHHPGFQFIHADVTDLSHLGEPMLSEKRDDLHEKIFVHLAALVGFPACQKLGREETFRINVGGVKRAYELAERLGTERFIFSSTYSVYGLADDGKPVGEASALNPQSIYGESKAAAEEYLISVKDRGGPSPIIFRFSTLFGVSPRMRFDLVVNQFTLEAYKRGTLKIFEKNVSRSFLHLSDTVRGIRKAMDVPIEDVGGEIINLGSDSLNFKKKEIIGMIREALPETKIQYEDLHFDEDMRDVSVDFSKARKLLKFEARTSVQEGIDEVISLLASGLIRDPYSPRYRNADFIVS
jgi:nucleoside-diphosphate-sugar epimerase